MEEAVRSHDSAPDKTSRIALWLICAAACALFVVGAIRFYFGPDFALFFDSDAAVQVLLANEVLQTGNVLPTTWYFGNDEIWTLSPHVFVMPFVAAFGVSTLPLKLGNMLCVGVMVIFLTLPLHRITRSWPYSILVAAGVFAVFSGFQEVFVYLQTAYGWFCAQFAILIYLALRMQDERGPEPWRLFGRVRWTTALYALFLVNLAIDSWLRAATYWVVPAVAVALVFPISKTRSRAFAISTAMLFLAGVLLHVVISRHVLSHAGVTASLLQPISKWQTSLATVASGLPVAIGYAKAWYATFFGVLGGVRFCFFLIAAFVVLFASPGNGPGSAECRFFARLSSVMLLVVLAVLMVGNLATTAVSVRYLLPPALLCLAAFMAILWCRFSSSAYGIAAIAALFVLTFCGGAVELVSRNGPVAFGRDCDAPANICRLAKVLAQMDIRQGYATYWKSNVTTVALKGRNRTCGISPAPNLAPFRWLISKDCFDPPTDDRYFLAFDRAEIADFGREHLISEAGTPEQVVKGDEFEVWIYVTAKANLDWLRR